MWTNGEDKKCYAQRKTSKLKRKTKEDVDKSDLELILWAYNYRGYKKGARSIYMRLLRKGVRMNIKKIRRLIHKYNIICPIRAPNPYSYTTINHLLQTMSHQI